MSGLAPEHNVPAPWDVIRVEFPYVDQLTSKRRPALVLATHAVHERFSLIWVLMITSARHSMCPGDVSITDLATAGVSRACFVRTEKIATVDARYVEAIGRLTPRDCAEVTKHLRRLLDPIMPH
jgi:mRNA interferase MazF